MDEMTDWIQRCRLQGYSDEQIKSQMSFTGYSQRVIDKHFPRKGASKSFHVGVALISIFLILVLISGLAYFFVFASNN